MNKVGCFIHSTNMPIWKDEILISLIHSLQLSGLLDALDFLFISNIGAPLDEKKICGMHPKIRVQHNSSDLNLFENVTIKTLHAFSRMNPDYKLLYLHTKGVSHEKNGIYTKGILSWNKYVLYCLSDQYKACLKLLNVYDTVGSQYTNDETNPPHYSGNFWWATSKYISSLSVHDLKLKYDAEFWLMRNNPTFYNIFSLHGMYENVWDYSGYSHFIPQRMKSKIVYCKFSTYGTGLFNQLYSLVNSMIIAAETTETHTIVIVESFLTDIHSNNFCDSAEILHYDQMNEFLRPYNISIINKAKVKINISTVYFGLYEKRITNITDIVKTKFFHDNQLIIPRGTDFNIYCEDPCRGERKLIYVNYTLNGHEFSSVFDEGVVREIRSAHLDFKDYTHVSRNYYSDVWYSFIGIGKFPQHRTLCNTFLKNIVFQPRFYELAQRFIDEIPSPKRNIMHIRNEIDAIDFWGTINRMSPEEYRERLENKYIALIQKYLSKNSVTVLLTANTNSKVIDFMRENGYPYVITDKTLVKGREVNAIVDYILCRYCTGVYIGNVNPYNFHGSTFSYGILNYLGDRTDIKKVCIDTDRILDDEYVL
jgi:hypothetical protein